MKIDDLVVKYLNRKKYERQLGRYNASEVYSIIKGETTPENFFEIKNVDEYGAKCISTGIAMENYLTKVFTEMEANCEFQVKKEIKINNEIVLVAKPDFVFKDFIIETKCPNKLFTDIPIWYTYQLESYYRAFYLPVYLGRITAQPFSVRLISYIPSKLRWSKIQRTLVEFHTKLKKVVNNK